MNTKASVGLIVFSILIATIAADCEAVQYKSRLMKKKEAEGTKYLKSAVELRWHLDDLASVFTGVIEQAADGLITVSTKNEVKQHALLWKINGIPMAYRALFHPDPAVAILDAWAFSMQMVNYFEHGFGKEDFGQWYQIAHNASLRLEKRLEQLVASGLPDGNLDTLKDDFQSWVMGHPIAHGFIYRDTVIPVLGNITSDEEFDTLQTVGSLSIGMEEMAEQLAVYMNLMTKQARWQTELILAETFKNQDAQEAALTFFKLVDSLNQISPVVVQLPELIAQERKSFFTALESERETILQSIDEQRIATISGIDSSSDRILQTTMDQSKELIDYLFVRALQLLAVSFLCAMVLAILVIHLKGKGNSKPN